MKTKLTTFFIPFLYSFIIINSGAAQNDLNDQLKKIDGTVDKITIAADGKEFTFEGSDAEALFKKMKVSKSHSFVWKSSDDSKDKKVIMLDMDVDEDLIEAEGEDVFIIKSGKDLCEVDEGLTKKIKVELENGEKIVTVTTKENGEEKTEVYEGEEADEYIKMMKSENDDFNIEIFSDKNCKKVKKIIIETEKEENNE